MRLDSSRRLVAGPSKHLGLTPPRNPADGDRSSRLSPWAALAARGCNASETTVGQYRDGGPRSVDHLDVAVDDEQARFGTQVGEHITVR